MGLSGYEAQVYLALLGETRAPASRVVRKSGVPQSKVYGALNSLIARGFAEQVLGDVKLYRGLPPALAFENYRRHVEEGLRDSRAAMHLLSESAPSEPSLEPGSLGIRLVRQPQYSLAVAEAMAGASSQCLIAANTPLEALMRVQDDLSWIRREVRVRTILEPGRPDADAGEVRVIGNLPLRFAVIDRAIAVLEMMENDGSAVGLLIPNSDLAQRLEILFNTLWSQARDLTRLPEAMAQPVAS